MIESINLSFQCNVETISHFLGACDCPLPNRKFSLQRVVLRLFEVFSLHWGLRVCIVLVATASYKNVETRRKTDLSFFKLLFAVANPGEGPWSPLIFRPKWAPHEYYFGHWWEMAFSRMLLRNRKCAVTSNSCIFCHGRHHRIWARALKLTNMLNANVHKKPCYRHYEVVNSEVKKP